MGTGLFILVLIVLLIRVAYKYQQGIRLTQFGLTDAAVAGLLIVGCALLW